MRASFYPILGEVEGNNVGNIFFGKSKGAAIAVYNLVITCLIMLNMNMYPLVCRTKGV